MENAIGKSTVRKWPCPFKDCQFDVAGIICLDRLSELDTHPPKHPKF